MSPVNIVRATPARISFADHAIVFGSYLQSMKDIPCRPATIMQGWVSIVVYTFKSR